MKNAMEINLLENFMTPSTIADALYQIFDWYIPVIICVGTDSAIGDTLGPLCGTKLKDKNLPCFVYGSLDKTITAKEIQSVKDFIACVHPLSKTLVIDAAVGSEEDVGKLKITNNGIYPGLGADKKLPKLGDASIIGIVAPRSKNNHVFMNLTRFSPVYKMAQTISDGISLYVDSCLKKPAYKSVNGYFSKL